MKSKPLQTYEDVSWEYLGKISALIEIPHDEEASSTAGFPTEVLLKRGQEIAKASAHMIEAAQEYLDSADPIVRQAIRYHFIAQAAVELLLGLEILQRLEEEAGNSSMAAIRATYGAALREAVGAAGKAISAPVFQGIPTGASYRVSDSATIGDAASGLTAAVESATTNILQRVQALGEDITGDLVSGNEWDEVIQCASASEKEINAAMKSLHKGAVGAVLLCVRKKVSALSEKGVTTGIDVIMREWLNSIRGADQVMAFHSLVDHSFKLDALKSVVSTVDCSIVPAESITKASDRIKSLSEKFIFLLDCMRKLEEAIRLAKLIDAPRLRLVTVGLQILLLSALVNSGQEYIEKDLIGIIRALGMAQVS